jgi:hypothetical protein
MCVETHSSLVVASHFQYMLLDRMVWPLLDFWERTVCPSVASLVYFSIA